jgi:hypothetical protein
MNWTYYDPVFAYQRMMPSLVQLSAWSGHRFFAYDFVRFLQPRTIVELGTHWGLSFFSFCQAVADSGSGARCFAVDSWVGDPHSGVYPEQVYYGARRIAELCYPGVATLLRSQFDEAIPLSANQSIDLLHIDGYHTYEAVRHDYEAWLPKLAPNGAVLFHDTMVHGNDFGVYRLWEELKVHPHVEFGHSFGLGVLFPKGCPVSFANLMPRLPEWQYHYAFKV